MDSSDDELLNVFANQWEASASGSDKADVPDTKSLEVLFKKFGHRSFRPFQWQIISSILKDKRDNCAIMTTGYGKSLCYQFPAVFSGGVTLVISPLISLMEDQVLSLTIADIPACLLGSAQKKTSQTIKEILENRFSLVYLTPELCTGEFGKALLKDMHSRLQISLIAVDEAHCVSSWGHDFRHSYRQLGILKNLMPGVPILAVTATATELVRKDIVKSLNLKNPQTVCTGFDRPNLYYAARPKGANILEDLKALMKRQQGQWVFDGPTIIYCITRKDTVTISELLQFHNVPCLVYHAGLSLTVRKDTHEQFVKDKVPVIVATIAFGMGIDKPDIRNVIHYGSSSSIESYYQEVGRAGRDGLPSKCITFYSPQDFHTHGFLMESGSNSSRRLELLDTMKQYLNSRKCRRTFLVSYFEGNASSLPKRTDCCDNCAAKADQTIYEGVDDKGLYDFTEDALKYLSAVSTLGGKFGHGMYILFLRGSRSSKIPDRLKSHSSYGSGKAKSEEWWKALANTLELAKLLKQIRKRNAAKFSHSVYEVSEQGREFLSAPTGSRKLLQEPSAAVLSLLAKAAPTGWISSHRPTPSSSAVLVHPEETQQDIDKRLQLLRLLRNARSQLARSSDCMPYMVASDFILMEMARHQPRNLERLQALKIEGFTEARIEKFGQQLLDVIKNNTVQVCDSSKNTGIVEILKSHPIPGAKLCSSSSISYEHFAKSRSVKEVASTRNLAPSTIITHLVAFLRCGYPIKLEELGVTPPATRAILQAINQLAGRIDALTPIKNLCPHDVTFEQIKCVCAYWQVRKHLEDLGIPFEEFDVPLESPDSEVEFDDRDDLLSALVDQMEHEMEEDKKQELLYDQAKSKKARVDDAKGGNSKQKLPVWLMKKKV